MNYCTRRLRRKCHSRQMGCSLWRLHCGADIRVDILFDGFTVVECSRSQPGRSQFLWVPVGPDLTDQVVLKSLNVGRGMFHYVNLERISRMNLACFLEKTTLFDYWPPYHFIIHDWHKNSDIASYQFHFRVRRFINHPKYRSASTIQFNSFTKIR